MSTAAPDGTARPVGAALGTVLVGVTVVLLLGIPSELIVKPLGAAGTPAQMAGVVLLVLWLGARVMRWHRPSSVGPVGWLLLGFVSAMTLAYVAGASRPMRTAEEATSSDRAMISLAAWCGIALAVAAGLTTMRQLATVLRILAGGVVVVAALGIVQFFTGLDLARMVTIPGLTANHVMSGDILRSDFRRVTATTAHPIEFGVVLSSVLPFVVHFARFSTAPTARRRWWVGAAVVAAALPMAVARSGILGAAIVSLVVLPTLPARLRRQLVVAIGVGAIAMSFVVPGLLGTLRGLFLGAANDPSTQGRKDDYAPVFHYASESLLLGRGPGTFIPSLYRTLDNQYLGTLVEAGLVGIVALVALVLGSTGTALRVRSRSTDPRVRDLCVCLAAALISFVVNTATFDLFGFAMAVGVLFLLIGAVGALTRITRATDVRNARTPAPGGLTSTSTSTSTSTHRRRVTRTVVVLGCCLLPVLVAGVVVAEARPAYLAVTSFVVEPPLPSGKGDVRAAGSADGAASVLWTVMNGPNVQDRLARADVRDPTIAIGEASLMWGSDILGYGPQLTVAVQAPTADAASADAALVLDIARTTLAGLQVNAGVEPTLQLRLDDVVAREPYPVLPHRSRGVAGLLLLAALMTGAGAGLIRRRPVDPPPPRVRHRRPATPPVPVAPNTLPASTLVGAVS